jgi:hypothetical protein
MAEKVISLRDKLRAKTVGAKKEFRQEEVLFDGETFIVKQPSVLQRGQILQKSKAQVGDAEKLDTAQLFAWATIHCVYTPDGEQVFDEKDYESLVNQPAGGFVDTFGAAAMKLMNVDTEQIAKNSGKTPKSSSSTT